MKTDNTPGFNLHRTAAATMFRVKPHEVTNDMVKVARTAMRGLLYSPAVVQTPSTPIRVGVGMASERQRSYAFWPKCPECHQDATAMYAGQPGCHRCGWPTPRRKANF